MAKKSKVNIFGRTITIKYIKNLSKESHLMGFYDSDSKTINIDASLKDQDLRTTLSHEIFHAMCDRLGLNQTSLPMDIQEILCEGFSWLLEENNIKF